METTKLIAQLALMLLLAHLIYSNYRKRKLKTKSEYHSTYMAVVVLFVWLYFAGSFTKLINLF